MPVSVIVFGAVLACGLIVMAMTRSQWADELGRLGKTAAADVREKC